VTCASVMSVSPLLFPFSLWKFQVGRLYPFILQPFGVPCSDAVLLAYICGFAWLITLGIA
jgi:hypothetical protein